MLAHYRLEYHLGGILISAEISVNSQPVHLMHTLYLFFSQDASRNLPQIRSYAQRVDELVDDDDVARSRPRTARSRLLGRDGRLALDDVAVELHAASY